MSVCLLLLIVLPLVGAAVVSMAHGRDARPIALLVSVLCVAAAIAITVKFNFHQNLSRIEPGQKLEASVQIQFPQHANTAEMVASEQGLGVSFHLGADSISLWLILLTAFVTPLALLASTHSAVARPREYYGWMLVLLSALNGVFLARDLLLFYIFFELTLVPAFFLIGIGGGSERRHAAGKFFLYTFAGSVLMLVGIIYVGVVCGTFDLSTVTSLAPRLLAPGARWLVLLSLLAGLAVKVPLFPFHTWQAAAYAEAPAPGSAILAGVMAKLGTYGFLRLILPLGIIDSGGYPHFDGAVRFISVLCIIGILYAALIAWVQRDMKKLLAYSSFSHLGFCVLGMMALNVIGFDGALLYMINHGLSTVALFLLLGMIIQRVGTRDLEQVNGLAKRMPIFSFFFVLFMFSSIGLPGLNGFVSEFLTILGAFTSDYLGKGFGILAALGVILGALYMLHMTAKLIFGPLKLPTMSNPLEAFGPKGTGPIELVDLNGREIALLVPLALSVVLLGVVPRAVLTSVEPALELIRTAPTSGAIQATVKNDLNDAGMSQGTGSLGVQELREAKVNPS